MLPLKTVHYFPNEEMSNKTYKEIEIFEKYTKKAGKNFKLKKYILSCKNGKGVYDSEWDIYSF